MGQKKIEIILMRQLASYLATPVFLVDPEGRLLYFNEAAEPILGRRFEEVGEMAATDWIRAMRPRREEGTVPVDEIPVTIALRELRPAQGRFRIAGFDGMERVIEITAVPLAGQAGSELGVVGFFRELWA